MSKSDKEYHIKLQQKSLVYLKFEKEEYEKLSQKIKDLEANPAVKEYIEIKTRFHKKMELVADAERQLGLWTYYIDQIKED